MANFFGLLGAGLIVGISVIIGLLAIVGVIGVKMQKIKHKPDDLLPAFVAYLSKIDEEEWYEQRTEVLEIIKELAKGNLPEELIDKYQIKKDLLIHTESHGNGSTFRFESKYTILELKPVD